MHKKISHSTLFQLIEAGHMARQVLLRPLTKFHLQPGDDAILLGSKKKKPTTDARLSQLTGLSQTSLQLRINRLIELSLLHRTEFKESLGPATRLSKDGRAIRKQLIAHWVELDEALMNDLSKTEKKRLRQNMERFVQLLSL